METAYYPSTDELIMKAHSYNGIQQIKQGIFFFVETWIDPEGITLSEIVRERQVVYDLTYM